MILNISRLEVNLNSFLGKSMTSDAFQGVGATLFHSERSSTVPLLSSKVTLVTIFSADLVCATSTAPSTRTQH